MKKLFTLFTALLFIGSFLAKAESITVYITDASDNDYAEPQTAELTLSEDGTYTIPDFLNSGSPLSFTITKGDQGYDTITFSESTVNPYDYQGTTFNYFYDYTTNSYPDCTITPIGSTSTMTLGDMVLYPEYSYVYNYENEDYKHYAAIYLGAYYTDNDLFYGYACFTFNLDEQSGIANVAADKNAPVEYFNLQGMRVDNPTNGLYIRRQGKTAAKVLVK